MIDPYNSPKQLQRLQQQLQMSTRVQRSLEPHEILNSAAMEVQQILQADRVEIYRSVSQTEVYLVAEALNDGGAVPQAACVPLQVRDLFSLLVSPQADQFDSAEEDYRLDDVNWAELRSSALSTIEEHPIKATLSIPIRKQNGYLGFIHIERPQAPQWLASEVSLVESLAEQLAIALHHAELYQQALQQNVDLGEEIQRRTEELQRAVLFESTLKRITDKVRDSLDEELILQAVVKELTLALELGGCNSALYDLDQGTSTIHYEYTNSVPAYQGRVAQMDQYPEIYYQLKQGYSFQFCSLEPNPDRGRVVMLACPIFVDPSSSQGVEQSVLGDLWLIHQTSHIFTEFEVRLAEQVANQCAIAIRQARLYQAAQGQVQQLEKLNHLKDEFLSTVSHELRTPITNVKMAIHMLKLSQTEEKRQRYLDILETETLREAELIDELLDLQRLEANSLTVVPEVIHLNQRLPEIMEPFRTRAAAQQQIFTVDCPNDLPPLTTDFGILRRVLSELFNNACKYTSEGHSIRLTIRAETLPADLQHGASTIAIFNLQNETEIPAEDLPHIFEKFYRVIQTDRYKRGGTGLGLALVQKRVEQLNGSIAVDSKDGWTTFTIRIPSFQE